MKTTLLLACALALSALPLSAVEPENLVENGDFQTGNGNQFYAITGWYNCGTGLNQGASARTDTGPGLPGEFSATINDRFDSANNKFGPTAHSQRTKHVIQAGDAFSLSYDWRPADEFWQKRRDIVRFVLFATEDNNLSGPRVWSETLDSDFFFGRHTEIKFVSQETKVVPAAAVGKRLFILFHGLDTEDGTTGNTHYARVDNIKVSLLPELKKP